MKRNRLSLLRVPALALVLLWGLNVLHCDSVPQKLKTLRIRVGGYPVTAEIAATPEERQRGLMYRTSMEENEGMLFVFPREEIKSFWMKNTYIPLDVGYFDSQGFLIEYMTMQPDDGSRLHTSSEPALYALEMNQGWFRKHGLKKYAKLELPVAVRGL